MTELSSWLPSPTFGLFMAMKTTVPTGSWFLSSAPFSLVTSVTRLSTYASRKAVSSVVRCLWNLLGGKEYATRGETGV